MVDIGSGCLSYLSETFFDAFPFRTEFGVLEFSVGGGRLTVYGYSVAQWLVQVLKGCGDNLTRENVMTQAASLKDLKLGMLLPGIAINTGANDFFPIKQLQMERFKGESWELFGPVMSGDIGS